MTNNQNNNGLNITDAPTTEDLLEYEKFVAPVVEKILQADKHNTPFTIGVYGSWGSGKTSFLKMVEKKLRKSDKEIQSIWFNAWKYDKEENLWAALIQTILEQIKIVGSPTERLSVRFQIWKCNLDFHSGALSIFRQLLSPLFRLVLIVITIGFVLSWDATAISGWIQSTSWLYGIPFIGAHIGTFLETVTKLLVVTLVGLLSNAEAAVALTDDQLRLDFDKFRKKYGYREHIAFLDEFSKEFQNIIQITRGGKPVVIIIDDLDRCMPEKALQVLETVKLFLDAPNCVFLIAVDRDVVEHAVLSRYKHLTEYIQRNPTAAAVLSTFRGEDYFDKIVQLPITLPNLTDKNMQGFIEKLCENQPHLAPLAPLFAAGIPANPRKVKRAILLFDYIYQVTQAKKSELNPTLLAKLMIIQLQYRQLYGQIVEDPQLLPALEKYFNFQARPEKGENATFGQDLNPIIREKAEGLAVEFRPVAGILVLNQDKDDFGSLDLIDLKDNYIYLVSKIAEATAEPKIVEPAQRPTENIADVSSRSIEKEQREQEVERRYYRHLQDRLKKNSLQAAWRSDLPNQTLYIEPEFSFADDFDLPAPISLADDNRNQQQGLGIRDLFSGSSRLFVVGSPGIGKTAFVQQIASVHLDALINQSQGNAPKREPTAELKAYGFDQPLLPIILQPPRSFAQFQDKPSDPNQAFYGYFLHQIKNLTAYNEIALVLERRLEKGGCIIIVDEFDTLDIDSRPYFLRSFQEFQLTYPFNYYVITSRPYTVSAGGHSLRMPDTLFVEINPLTTDRIKNHLSKIDSSRAEKFMSALSPNDNLSLLTNPTFLSTSWRFFTSRGMLPDDQNQLIEIYLDEAIRDRELSKGEIIRYKPTQIGNVLRPIAEYLEQRNSNRIFRGDVYDLIRNADNKLDLTEFLRIVTERLGILIEPERGQYAFAHIAFQEYFRDYPANETSP